jgi:hypothetical protein
VRPAQAFLGTFCAIKKYLSRRMRVKALLQGFSCRRLESALFMLLPVGSSPLGLEPSYNSTMPQA